MSRLVASRLEWKAANVGTAYHLSADVGLGEFNVTVERLSAGSGWLVGFSHKSPGTSLTASALHARAAAHRLVAMLCDTAGDLDGTDPLDAHTTGVEPRTVNETGRGRGRGWVYVQLRGADALVAIAPFFGDALTSLL